MEAYPFHPLNAIHWWTGVQMHLRLKQLASPTEQVR